MCSSMEGVRQTNAPECHLCHGKGHVKAKCPNQIPPGVCYKCGIFGHSGRYLAFFERFANVDFFAWLCDFLETESARVRFIMGVDTVSVREESDSLHLTMSANLRFVRRPRPP